MYLYFVRHGESEANLLKVFSNRGFKHGLTEKGRTQALNLAEKLMGIPFQAIYSSPLLRAVETADILSGKMKANYQIARELVEFDVGILEGRSDEESWRRYFDLTDHWFTHHHWDMRIDGGESFNDIKERTLPFIHRLQSSYPDDCNILIIGHGGTFRCLFPLILSNIHFCDVKDLYLSNTEYVLACSCNGNLKCLKWGERVLE